MCLESFFSYNLILSWANILFVMLRLARSPPTWEMAVHEAAADDVFGGD